MRRLQGLRLVGGRSRGDEIARKWQSCLKWKATSLPCLWTNNEQCRWTLYGRERRRYHLVRYLQCQMLHCTWPVQDQSRTFMARHRPSHESSELRIRRVRLHGSIASPATTSSAAHQPATIPPPLLDRRHSPEVVSVGREGTRPKSGTIIGKRRPGTPLPTVGRLDHDSCDNLRRSGCRSHVPPDGALGKGADYSALNEW